MEYLPTKSETLYKYVPFLKNDHKYTFLDSVRAYLDVEPFYVYLNSYEEFQLKNIWNQIHREWRIVHKHLEDDRGYRRSAYSKKQQQTSYLHTMIRGDTLDTLLNDFIQGDSMMALFVMRSLLFHGIPSLHQNH